jgi:hypothetical protein
MKARKVLLLIVSSLLITAYWIDESTASYGSSRTLLEPFEWEVIWCVGVPNGYMLTVLYNADTSPVDFYIVQRDFYNRTSRVAPDLFVLHDVGQRSEIVVDGPLGDLYFLVYSPMEQWFESESYIETPMEKIGRVYGPPLAGMSIILLLGALLAWYWLRRRK